MKTAIRKQRTGTVLFVSFLLGFVLLASPGAAQRQNNRRTAQRASASKPKLVLVIVVDQFRYDFLERFGDLFGNSGFKRLINQGAFFTNANYDYVPTVTAAGHAAIFTGSIPSQNGIVGNAFYDRDIGKVRIMVTDDSAHFLKASGASQNGGAASPRDLIGSTIGDQMRFATNFQSKVVAASLKDRAAVLPGGQRPNGAYWYSDASGEFISSDYYFKELPAWVKKFDGSNKPDKYFGMKWERVLPPAAYLRAQADNLPQQRSPLGPHLPLVVNGGEDTPGSKFYAAFPYSPMASEYLEEFGKVALEAESLGADEFPDLLSISFSSPDLTGHAYGPDSQEVEDTYIRLDRVIADLLGFIDKKVGLANTIIAMTGDHGVAPVPEYIKSKGYDAGRLSSREVIDAANKALGARFGEGKWIVGFVNDQLYLDQKLIADKKISAAEAERVAGEAALSVSGIVSYFTRTQIMEGRMPASAVARRVTNGFYPKRSGDVWITTKPFYFFGEGVATTHGSPYNYDTHVPVILFGAGVLPGRYNAACTPSDIAPTLAALLAIEPPANRTGRVLVEALGEPVQGRAEAK